MSKVDLGGAEREPDRSEHDGDPSDRCATARSQKPPWTDYSQSARCFETLELALAADYQHAIAVFWRRHWFVFCLAIVAVAGFLAPEAGVALRSAGFALPLLTAFSLFLSGLVLDTAGLRKDVEPRGVALGLVSIYVVAPLLAIVLSRAIGPPIRGPDSEGHFFFEAMMIVAAQASTIASAPAFTLAAGGNQALALSITLSSNLMTAFVTPAILRLTAGTVVSFPIGRMMLEDATVVLLPVVLGGLVHRFAWSPPPGSKQAIVWLSQGIILVFVHTGVASAAVHLSQSPSVILAFVATAASLHLALLLWNARAASWIGLSPEGRTAVVLCGSQKTLPNGIYLWDKFFPANPHGALALVCYHVFQLVVDGLLSSWLSPKKVLPKPEVVDGA